MPPAVSRNDCFFRRFVTLKVLHEYAAAAPLSPAALPRGWGISDGLPPMSDDPSPQPRKGGGFRIGMLIGWLAGGLTFAVISVVVLIYVHKGPGLGTSGPSSSASARSPLATVLQYVDTAFAPGDQSRIRDLICSSPQLGEVDALRNDLTDRVQRFHAQFFASVESSTVSMQGDRATVSSQVVLHSQLPSTSAPIRAIEKWGFSLVREGEWRMCSAHQIQ